MKKFFQDFKKFISRGNILDMAVGVIIGGAFSAIVTAFTNKIIMPIINLILSAIAGGDDGLSSVYTFLKRVYVLDDNGVATKTVDLANSIYIDWGSFITAVLNFLIIALTLFVIMKVAMKSNEFFKKTAKKVNYYKLTKEEKKEIKAKKLTVKTKEQIKNFKLEKENEAKVKKEQEEAEAKRKAEEERLANPTETDLLKEIIGILKNKNQ